MATAGRILIIPRGGYSSTTQYEPLDLVLYNGDSWLCKQSTKGIEPSDINSSYWYRFTENPEDLSSALGKDIVLKNSCEGALKINRTLGKSEQRKTSGKNKWDNNATALGPFGNTRTETGFKFVRGSGSGGSYYFYKCPIRNGETITFSAKFDNYIMDMYIYETAVYGTQLAAGKATGKITYTAAADYPDAVFAITISSAQGDCTVSDIQIEAGSEVTEYEIYTGSIASPNPQYPQEIVSTGQMLTTGAQLIPFVDKESNYYTIKDSVITVHCTPNEDILLNVMGTYSSTNVLFTLPVGTYTLSPTIYIISYNGTNRVTKSGTFTLTTDLPVTGVFVKNQEYTNTFKAGVTYNFTVYPMLNVGSEAKPWEPYTVGVPAAVDVPIETEVLSGNLAFMNLKGHIVGDGSGKFNVDNDSESFVFECKKGCTYIWNTNEQTDRTYFAIYDKIPTNSYYPISGTVDSNAKSNTPFVANADGYGVIYVKSSLNDNIKNSFIVNMGEVALPYQPYTKQTLTINKEGGFAGIPVTDVTIANYTDADGQMWVCDTREWERGVDVQRYRYVDVSISSMTKTELTNTVKYGKAFAYNAIAGSSRCLCTHSNINKYNTADYEHYYVDKQFAIFIAKDNVDSFEASEKVGILYPLETPIETPIPEAELSAWRALHSNEPTTTIFSDADVEVEYATSKVGAVVMDADMRSRGNEQKIAEVMSDIEALGTKQTELETGLTAINNSMQNVLTKNDFTVSGDTLILNWL